MNQSDGHDLVDHRQNEPRGRRVRFFIDPSLSDEEIRRRIIKIAERHFNLPEDTPAELDTQASG